MNYSKIFGTWFAAAVLCHASQAAAQAYPVKPIRVIATYSGGAETIARLIGNKMAERMGQPFVIEAITGANGSIGALTAARAAPDGYTLLASTGATQIIRGFLVKDVPYDPFRDFTAITHTFDAVGVIATHPGGPASLREMIDRSKQTPGKLTYGTTGIGSAYHMSAEQIQILTGAEFLHVPYKAGPQALTDLVALRVDTIFTVMASTRPFVEAGKVRYLATLNNSRSAALPNVPTVRDVVPGFRSVPFWGGYFGPAKLPDNLAQRLHTEFANAIRLPDVTAPMEQGGLIPVAAGPATFAATIKEDVEQLRKLVKAVGIQPE
jgi:tripartite-type tricarboxylate transporter receptor subunit TctC